MSTIISETQNNARERYKNREPEHFFKDEHELLLRRIGILEAIFLIELLQYFCAFAKNNMLIDHPTHGIDWFPVSVQDLEEALCLNGRRQKTIIRKLSSLNLIESQKFGTSSRRHFRINYELVEKMEKL